MTKEYVSVWKLLRSKIEHEDSWIQQRITWLYSSNAFLLAGFAALSKFSESFEQQESPSTDEFLVLISMTGLALTLVIFLGLIASANALGKVAKEYHLLVPQEIRRTLPSLYSEGNALILGRSASWGVCLGAMILWLVLLFNLSY